MRTDARPTAFSGIRGSGVSVNRGLSKRPERKIWPAEQYSLNEKCVNNADYCCNVVYARLTDRQTHLFNGLFSWTTRVSQYQKVKRIWILMKQEMTGWQWHQLDHIICTSLQSDHHANTSSLNFYMPDALPNAKPTASKLD